MVIADTIWLCFTAQTRTKTRCGGSSYTVPKLHKVLKVSSLAQMLSPRPFSKALAESGLQRGHFYISKITVTRIYPRLTPCGCQQGRYCGRYEDNAPTRWGSTPSTLSQSSLRAS